MTFLRSLFAERHHLFLIVVGLFFLGLTLFIFSPFLFPISLAVAFSFGLAPIVDRIQSKKSKWVTIGYVAVGLSIFIGIFSHAIQRSYSLLFGQDRETALALLISLKDRVTTSIESLLPFLSSYAADFPSLNFQSLQGLFHNNLEKLLAFGAGIIAATLTSLPETLLYFFTFIIFLSILVYNRRLIYQSFRNANLVDDFDLALITRWAQESSFKMIYVNVVVGSVQALIITLTAYFAGFPEWSLIFALVFCASFFPLVGTAPIAIVLVLLAYSSLGTASTLALAIAGLATGVVDNVLRSFLVSNEKNGLNSWVTLIGIIGAIAVFGFSGIFLGPFILSFAVKMWPRLHKVIMDAGGPT